MKRIVRILFLFISIGFFSCAFSMQESELKKEPILRSHFFNDLQTLELDLPDEIDRQIALKSISEYWARFEWYKRSEHQLFDEDIVSVFLPFNFYHWASYRVSFDLFDLDYKKYDNHLRKYEKDSDKKDLYSKYCQKKDNYIKSWWYYYLNNDNRYDISLSHFFRFKMGIIYLTDRIKKKATEKTRNVRKSFNRYFFDSFQDYCMFSNLRFNFPVLFTASLEEAKEEVLRSMVCRYKIHLQVKPEYLMSFVKDFTQFVTVDKRGRNIYSFKATTQFRRGYNYFNEDDSGPEHALSPIVVYVTLLPGIKEEKNKLLNEIVEALVQRYEKWVDEIALKIEPRFSYKVNDLIYVCGGDGDNKKVCLDFAEHYKNELSKDPRDLYDKKMNFFKGFEYEYK